MVKGFGGGFGQKKDFILGVEIPLMIYLAFFLMMYSPSEFHALVDRGIVYYFTHTWLIIIPLSYMVLSIFITIKIILFGGCPLILNKLKISNFTQLLLSNVIIFMIAMMPLMPEFIIICLVLSFLIYTTVKLVVRFYEYLNKKFKEACEEEV